MNRTTLFVSLGAAALLGGCGAAGAATRDYQVGGFDRVLNRTPLDVHIRTGAPVAVHAEAPQPVLDRLQVTVVNGTLTIGSRPGGWSGWSFGNSRMRVEVSVPALHAAQVDGPGDMTVDRVAGPRFAATLNGPGNLSVGAVAVRDVQVVVNGPGDIRLAGQAENGTLAVHGPGNIKAAELTLRDAAVNVSGPGDLAVTATGTAHGSLSGPGDITVHGGARCSIDKHGPGDVHCG